MNYAELQQAVIEDTHRPDLASLVPRFIREGEGMIRREMTAFMLTTTIEEAARQANSAQYSLPTGILYIRRLALQGQTGPGITRISLDSITSYAVSNRVAVYAEPGDGLIEFRGVPATGAIFDLNYFGMPAPLVADEDTNALLEENETLYKAGAMFYLYQNTQDRELATDAIDVFNSIIETLNDEAARKIGGAQITASYQFGNGGSY
jgi:hypothetical protein